MNIDLSHKSICELRFDHIGASEDEKLVASRVESLVAAHNRIQRIDGLGGLFHCLVHLDLSHNSLGRWPAVYATAPVRTPRNLMGAAPWIAALPASLHTLNLSHNGLRSLSDERTPTRCIRGGGDEIIKEATDHNDPALSEEDNDEYTLLACLRRACTLTVGLFFNRESFPQLCELDLSNNDFSLSLAASDTVEEHWNNKVEGLATRFSAQWAARTTSAVSILSMQGNTALLALNGIVCGLSALHELRAAACGITDLTAVAAAATYSPQLCTLDLSDCPVVASIVTAPRASLATFAEVLLLPYIIGAGGKDGEGVTEEQRHAMVTVARDVAQRKLDEIEKALPGGGLGHVLYAALLLQIIPQLREIDAGVNVVAARDAFLRAASEVMRRGDENSNTEERRPVPVVPGSQTPKTAQRRSPTGVETMDGSPLDHPRRSSPVAKKKVHTLWQPKQQRQLRGRGLLPPTLASSDGAQTPKQEEIEEKGEIEKRDVDDERVDGLSVPSARLERSRNARAATLAAMAAESAQLRPAVLVTPPTATKSGSDQVKDHINSNGDAVRGSSFGGAGVIGRSRGLLQQANAVDSLGNENTGVQISSVDGTNLSHTSSSQVGFSDLLLGTSRVDSSGESYEKKHGSKNGRLHGRVDNKGGMSAKSVSGKQNDTTHALQHTDPTISAQLSAIRIDTDNENEITSDGGTGGSFQRALAALTPLLVQRLRAEGLSLNSASHTGPPNGIHIANPATATSTSSSSTPPLMDPSVLREALEGRARTLEAALLASQERQRNAQSVVTALTDQLRADRQLITDQRREAARLRAERDGLSAANRTARRRLQKRQKEIAYGAQALQRREAQQQRETALRRIECEASQLRAAERRCYEQLAREKNISISGIATERKTRAEVLREVAVRERMASVAQREDPLAYAPRRFRASGTAVEIAEDVSGGSVTGADSAGTIATTVAISAATTHDRIPWRRQALYETGHSPYAEESEDMDNTEVLNVSGVVDSAEMIAESHEDFSAGLKDKRQARTLQELFEEAAMIRQRQHALQQRMRTSRSGPLGAVATASAVTYAVPTHTGAVSIEVEVGEEEKEEEEEEEDSSEGATATAAIGPAPAAQVPQVEHSGHVYKDESMEVVGFEIIEDKANRPVTEKDSRMHVTGEEEKKSNSVDVPVPSSDAQCIYEEILRQQRLQVLQRGEECVAEISRISEDTEDQYEDEREETYDVEANEKVNEEEEEEAANVSTRRTLFA